MSILCILDFYGQSFRHSKLRLISLFWTWKSILWLFGAKRLLNFNAWYKSFFLSFQKVVSRLWVDKHLADRHLADTTMTLSFGRQTFGRHNNDPVIWPTDFWPTDIWPTDIWPTDIWPTDIWPTPQWPCNLADNHLAWQCLVDGRHSSWNVNRQNVFWLKVANPTPKMVICSNIAIASSREL